jgi:hypothetical protein
MPTAEGDLVYLSTKNISFPKGLARKFLPKFVGPYRILEDFGNNSFRLELPDRMKQRGIHNVFHSSYLRIHLPNDNCLFPGRLDNQVAEFDEEECEWAVDRILSHKGTRSDAVFEVRRKSGDITWLPYERVDHLAALQEYFDVLDIGGVSELIEGNGLPPTDDPQVFLGSLGFRMSYIDPLDDPHLLTTLDQHLSPLLPSAT